MQPPPDPATRASGKASAPVTVHVYVYDLTLSHFQQKGTQTMKQLQSNAG
jgi:LysM repeat protein